MKINIWSDIRCPFCYIGKRKFERALERFPHKDKVEIVWRSFQLDPTLKTAPGLHVYDYLAEVKGMTREDVIQMHVHVKKAAEEVGLEFNFDRAVVANSYRAHRLIQLARTKGLANDAEEAMFRAQFTDGQNIDDNQFLIQTGVAIGLPEDEVRDLIATDQYVNEVNEDESIARSIGIRGVPFFIMNETVAVSGAQSPALFLQALEKAWEEYEKSTVGSK